MNEKNITLYHLSIVLQRISTYVTQNYAPQVHTHSSDHITSMNGYTIASDTNTDLHVVLSSGDSLNTAIGKLERSIANIVYRIETDLMNHVHDDRYYKKDEIDTIVTDLEAADQRVLDEANAYAKSTVDKAVSDLIDGAPEALNTLNELAEALNDDEQFATHVSEAIGQRVVGPSFASINNVAIFSADDGKSIKDSGYTIDKSVPYDAIFTDHNVMSTPGLGRTLYLVGTPNSGGETGTLGFDPGVFLSTDGSITASVFNGNLTGRAETAGVADEALKTRGALTVKVENADVDSFDGSASKTVNITRDLLDVHDRAYTEKATDADVRAILDTIFEL